MTYSNRLLLLALSMCGLLSACNGGIIGTSPGSALLNNQLDAMPVNAGPRMRSSLLSTGSTDASIPANANNYTFDDNSNDVSLTTSSLQRVTPAFSEVEFARLHLLEELTLLRSVSEAVLELCEDSEVSHCEIAAGAIQAQYTEEVIDQLRSLARSESSDDLSIGQQWLNRISSLQGTYHSFGSIYLFLEDNEFNLPNILLIEPLKYLPTMLLSVDWSRDNTATHYSVFSVDKDDGKNFMFHSDSNGQRITATDLQLAGSDSTISLEVTAKIGDQENIFINAINQEELSLFGQAADDQAFIASYINDSNTMQDVLLQEYFNDSGELINSEVCHPVNDAECIEFSEDEYPLYLTEIDFTETLNQIDLPEIIVSNLPADIEHFEIRSADAVQSFENSRLYCIGWRLPERTEFEWDIYCIENPTKAIGGVVASFDNQGNITIHDEAEITVR